MGELIQLFLLALLGSIIALVGGVVFLYDRKLSEILEKHSIPFAAGVLVSVSLLALIPESFEQIGESALFVVLLSFFVSYFLEHFLIEIHHHKEALHHHKDHLEYSVPLVIVGDTIHNFIDGIAIAASFFASPGLGLITAFSTFLHEVPHEIGDFGILLKAGWKRGRIFWINLVSASFTIVGAFLTLAVSENSQFIGFMMAVSAGIFLYLGTIDFLPHIDHGYQSKAKSMIPLVLGIAIMLAVIMFVPHTD
jgi:zinc and cadmium transporter